MGKQNPFLKSMVATLNIEKINITIKYEDKSNPRVRRNHDINKFVVGNFVHQNWFWLTGFVGANLFQNAFTNWCLLKVPF